MKHEDLKKFGVPADIIDAAKEVGMDVETLGKLVIKHSVTAVEDFLTWLKAKTGI